MRRLEYFVSYYDYYQPEAYIPSSDVYIEKEATTNAELDKLRLSATRSLFRTARLRDRVERQLHLRPGLARGLLRDAPNAGKGRQKITRKEIVSRLVDIPPLRARNDHDFRRGTFRVRGDVIEVCHDVRRLRLSHRVVGRRDREPVADRSAARAGASDLCPAAHLSQDALRDG